MLRWSRIVPVFAAVMLVPMLVPTLVRAQAADGQKLFGTTCAACHQPTGVGVPGIYPPLAGSEWVTGSEARLLRVILQGLNGEIDVEGETFNGAMPPWGPGLKDPEIAAIATYIRSSWGNKAAAVSAATVAQVRAATAARKTPWTAKELDQALSVHK